MFKCDVYLNLLFCNCEDWNLWVCFYREIGWDWNVDMKVVYVGMKCKIWILIVNNFKLVEISVYK